MISRALTIVRGDEEGDATGLLPLLVALPTWPRVDEPPVEGVSARGRDEATRACPPDMCNGRSQGIIKKSREMVGEGGGGGGEVAVHPKIRVGS